jgi:hypothetical protein
MFEGPAGVDLFSGVCGTVIDPAIKHLNEGSAMPNRMPHF